MLNDRDIFCFKKANFQGLKRLKKTSKIKEAASFDGARQMSNDEMSNDKMSNWCGPQVLGDGQVI
jgi:hypothetical protein